MKTKFTSDLLTQRLLQWVSCMGSLIQCHTNGAMELLLQRSGIAFVVVVTDRQLAMKLAACVVWMLWYRQLADRSKHCMVVTLSNNCRKPISMSSIMLYQQMHKEFVLTYLLLAALPHDSLPNYLLQGVVHMLQLPAN